MDWGLGHATRSLPLLRYILQKGCQLSIAASGPTAELLQNECPAAEHLNLPGYGITYPGQGRSFRHHLFWQGPAILRAIRREREWLRREMPRHRWDLVISDNRYGFTHPGVPSAILTHQLGVISGLGDRVDGVIRSILYHHIDRFSECWVPDLAGSPNLAGILSHPGRMPKVPTRYLGLLSRFEFRPDPVRSDLMLLLSGPEPQRSLLENKILSQLRDGHGSVMLVRGLPGGGPAIKVPAAVTAYDHLPADELARRVCGAGNIICRSGYSTLMDLLRLGKTAILVPTPGQTEQEYLGRTLAKAGAFACVEQDRFDLDEALRLAPGPWASPFSGDFGHFKKVVDDFVK